MTGVTAVLSIVAKSPETQIAPPSPFAVLLSTWRFVDTHGQLELILIVLIENIAAAITASVIAVTLVHAFSDLISTRITGLQNV